MEAKSKKYNKNYRCCGTKMRDWSTSNSKGLSQNDHLYCKSCGKHIYMNVIYSKKDWNAYVNDCYRYLNNRNYN